MKVIGRLTTKEMKWSNETIRNALKIHFTAGPTGCTALQGNADSPASNQNPAKEDVVVAHQVVAYHYSGNSTDGAEYRPIITEIVERAASIGLHVLDVTTDMGSPYQAMWKAFGVDHTKTSVPHPATPDRRLYFMPDFPHVVKKS